MKDYMKERRDSDDDIYQKLKHNAVFRRYANKRQAKKKRAFRSVKDSYYFLQYNAFIREWAQESLGATSHELDVLLWMSPIQIFTRKEFKEQMVGPFSGYKNRFKLFQDKGWIIEWNNALGAYYVFTKKVNKVIQEMHKMYFSENIDDISISFKPPKERDSQSLLDFYKNMCEKGTAKNS